MVNSFYTCKNYLSTQHARRRQIEAFFESVMPSIESALASEAIGMVGDLDVFIM